MTSQSRLPAARQAEQDDRAEPKRAEPAAKRFGESRVERLDWRGEGVVGDNHTD